MSSFSKLNIKPEIKHFVGDKISVSKILDKEIIIKAYKIGASKFEDCGQRLDLQIEFKDELRVVWTTGIYLIDMIKQMPAVEFPIKTKIINVDGHFEFV